MIGIDLTCFGKDEVLNNNIVSGIGTWISEILDYIIEKKEQQKYILIVNFYAEKFVTERFPGFKIVKIGNLVSNIILKLTGKSTETYLKNHGKNTKVVNKIKDLDLLWFPFAIPEIVYNCNVKTVITVHDFMKCNKENEKNSYEIMLKNADKIVVISEFIREELTRLFDNFKSSDISVIPNSITIDTSNEEICKDVKTPFILDINRYQKHKNAHTLLKAFERYLNEYNKDADLVFVGFGDEKYLEELKNYSQEKGISEKVHFMWKLETAKKNWLLKNASLFVSPSVNEGMGRTPVEAMLCKVPVLTTKETSLYEATLGLAEYCDDPYNDAEMAQKIFDILSKNKDNDKLSDIANQVESTYCLSHIWGRYEILFSNIL